MRCSPPSAGLGPWREEQPLQQPGDSGRPGTVLRNYRSRFSFTPAQVFSATRLGMLPSRPCQECYWICFVIRFRRSLPSANDGWNSKACRKVA
jgi:hypothetical protein